jgi:hypothetical protein
MAITRGMLAKARRADPRSLGESSTDYFGAVFLNREFSVPLEQALVQVDFEGAEHGIDGFHFDAERRSLYLFVFKWTLSEKPFKSCLPKLISNGMELVFGRQLSADEELLRLLDPHSPATGTDQLSIQLRHCLTHNEQLIDKVFVQLVYNGDPCEAVKSERLRQLRDDLQMKQYLLQSRFGRSVPLHIEFRSARTSLIGEVSVPPPVARCTIPIQQGLEAEGPAGEKLYICLAPLLTLADMYGSLGHRFFDRNVRAALRRTTDPNRALSESLKRIALTKTEEPGVFLFNHNGVSLSVEKIERLGAEWVLTEPRLLNGAQSITATHRFLMDHQDKALEIRSRLGGIQILCKVITDASVEFVGEVTINNNRQNPVHPWNLRANDEIQLEFQDWFRRELGIYYERQEGSLQSLSESELQHLGITEGKAIEIRTLAQTFLAVDGAIDKMTKLKDVFETQAVYEKVFSARRLKSNPRHLVLCYKIQYRIRRLLGEILERGQKKYEYIKKARSLVWALLCQAVLNADDLDDLAESYGCDLTASQAFVACFAQLASRRVRIVIGTVVSREPYASKIEQENYSFLSTRKLYLDCMREAGERFGWSTQGLP